MCELIAAVLRFVLVAWQVSWWERAIEKFMLDVPVSLYTHATLCNCPVAFAVPPATDEASCFCKHAALLIVPFKQIYWKSGRDRGHPEHAPMRLRRQAAKVSSEQTFQRQLLDAK
jgi:hypothetical protein